MMSEGVCEQFAAIWETNKEQICACFNTYLQVNDETVSAALWEYVANAVTKERANPAYQHLSEKQARQQYDLFWVGLCGELMVIETNRLAGHGGPAYDLR